MVFLNAMVELLIGFFLQNQTQTGTALQVFYNLGLLQDRVDEVISKHSSLLQSFFADTLDAKKVSSAQGNFSIPTSVCLMLCSLVLI